MTMHGLWKPARSAYTEWSELQSQGMPLQSCLRMNIYTVLQLRVKCRGLCVFPWCLDRLNSKPSTGVTAPGFTLQGYEALTHFMKGLSSAQSERILCGLVKPVVEGSTTVHKRAQLQHMILSSSPLFDMPQRRFVFTADCV